jgi:hypothetical protein
MKDSTFFDLTMISPVPFAGIGAEKYSFDLKYVELGEQSACSLVHPLKSAATV